jgi:N-acetylglucosaminyl-diphospho-decaprenol L-rhamnosyltransferase
MEMRPQLSIIIVNYNTGRLLERCLASLFENVSSLEVEVFVVDNASTDDSLARTSRFRHQLRLIPSQENLGFAGANNRALKECRGDYVLFLNPDTEVLDGALGKMFSFMEANKEVGFLVPKIYLPDGAFQESSFGPFPSLFNIILFRSSLATVFPFLRKLFLRRYYEAEGVFAVDWATGACLLCRRELLERLHGFDESFFMYCEDTDLCYRARKIGAKVYFYSGAKIIHHLGGSCLDRERKEAMLHQSRYSFLKKNRGLPHALASMAVVVTISFLKLALLSPVFLIAARSRRVREAVELYLIDLRWHLNLKNLLTALGYSQAPKLAQNP